ncbi:MAG: hypothetical protein HY293_13700 [Planctomycetes bacterium]|nr:hypothetical protein [Planctomycetota bacterium]
MTGPAEIWRVHQNAQFPPSCLPMAVDGVRLVKIDAVAGALLTASLRSDGIPRPLDESKRRDLERQRGLILKALQEPALDAEGRAYFERLSALSELVLKG